MCASSLQLHLRVVGRDQHVAGLRHEAGTDLAALLGADRDVLEVRVGAGQATGGGGGLVEGGVEAAVVADQLGEGVEVGRLELRDLPPLLDGRNDLVLLADRLEHAGIRGEACLAAALAREPQLLEQDLRELLRRADRELLAGQLPDAALELGGPLAEALADLRQALHVELHAGALHLHEHVHERQLDVVEEPGEAVLFEARALALGEHPSQDRALRDAVPALHAGGDAGLGGELLERIAAPRRVDQVRRDHRVVLEQRRRGGLLAHGCGLPVVVHERALTARHDEGGERLALRHQHLAPP